MAKSIVTSGGVTTDLQTVGVKVEMDEAIVLLSTWDVPLQQMLGSAPCHEVRIDWLEDTLTSQVVNCSSLSTDATNLWDIVVDDTSAIRVGDIIHADDAVLLATSYEVTVVVNSTKLTLVPAFGATLHDVNPTATVDVSLYRIIGQSLSEGADPKAFRGVDRTNPYNYTQIGQEAVQVSRTERKRETYGVADEYTHQVQKKFKELAIRMERALTTGLRYQSGSKRTMGGLFSFITTNSRSGVVANAKSLVNSLVRDCYNAGGTPRSLYVSPAVKVALSANIDPTLRRTSGSDTKVGYVVDSILTDFGTVEVKVDRHFPTTKGLLLQEEFDTRRVFDGYFHETLAQTGDSTKGEIVGEFSLEVKNQDAQGILTLTDAA
jgi:hypothetical protein